jgi:hypothetical protein
VDPPCGKEPAGAVCLYVRAPRRRLVFAGFAPPPRLAGRRRPSPSPPQEAPVKFALRSWTSRCISRVDWGTLAP